MASSVVLFSAVDSNGREGLWESNGTAGGTIEIASLESQSNEPYGDFTQVNGVVLFSGYGPGGVPDLYVTDGSTEGTQALDVAGASSALGLNPIDLTAVGGEVFFNGIDSAGNYGLWLSNGTAAGTYEVPGTSGLDPSSLVAYNGELLFTSLKEGGLWVASAGGAVSEVAGTSALDPTEMTVSDGKVYFINGADSSTSGYLYSTNGSGATVLFDLGEITDLTAFGSVMLFEGQDGDGNYDLFETNGTAGGTKEVSGTTGIFNNLQSPTLDGGALSPEITVLNGVAYFEADDPGGNFGLWSTNGTSASEISPIAGAPSSGIFPSTGDPDYNGPNFDVYGSLLLFDGVTSGGDSGFGVTGLWSTTGTATGTKELNGIVGGGYTGTDGLDPSNMTTVTFSTLPAVTGVTFNIPDTANEVFGDTVDISGTVTSGSSGVPIEIYDGTNLLGTVSPSFGSFYLDVSLAAGTYSDIRAVVTNAEHQSVSQSAPYSVQVGITGQPYQDLVDTYDAKGALDGQIYFSDGSPYLIDSVESSPEGETIYDYTGGSYFESSGTLQSYDDIYQFGKLIGSNDVYLYEGASDGQSTPSYVVYQYSASALLGVEYEYNSDGLENANYTGETVSVNPQGALEQVVYSGVSGASYATVQDNYVAGVFAGSQYLFTQTPVGATYSSYIENFGPNNAYTGSDFFFRNIAGQNYTTEEEDLTASGSLERVLLGGFTDGSLLSLEEDYNAGVYQDYIATYSSSVANYSNQVVEVNAAGKLVMNEYNGIKGEPYSSVESQYSNGVLTDTIYDFIGVTGQSYYAYQVKDNASGAGLAEAFDLNSGGHNLIALASGQTLTSLGDDGMTGSGSTTFMLDAVYGHDTIANLNSGDTVWMPQSEFASFNAISKAASYGSGGAVITATDGDTLTLKGVTTSAELQALAGDFKFHA